MKHIKATTLRLEKTLYCSGDNKISLSLSDMRRYLELRKVIVKCEDQFGM